MNSAKYFDMTLRKANSVTNIFQKEKKGSRFFKTYCWLSLSERCLNRNLRWLQGDAPAETLPGPPVLWPTRSVAHPSVLWPTRSVALALYEGHPRVRIPRHHTARDMPMTGRPGTLYIKYLPPDTERKPGGVLTAQRLNQRVVWLLPRESLCCLSLAPP